MLLDHERNFLTANPQLLSKTTSFVRLLAFLLVVFSFPGSSSSSSGSFFSPGYLIRNNFRGSECTNTTMYEQTITRLGECQLASGTGTAYFSQMLTLDLLASAKYTYSIQQNVYNNYTHCNSSSSSSASFAACASDSRCASSYILYDTSFSFVSGVCTASSNGLDSYTQTVVATNTSAFVQAAEPVLGSSEWSFSSRKGYAKFTYSSSACTGRYLQASLLVDDTCQGALAESAIYGNPNRVSRCNALASTVVTKQYSNSSFCVHSKGPVAYSNYSFVANTCAASAASSLSEPLQAVSSLFSTSSCYAAPVSPPTSSPPPPPPYPTAAPTTAAPNSMAPSRTTPAGLLVLFTGYLVIDNFDTLNCSSSSQYQQSIQTFDGNCAPNTGGTAASPYVKPFLYLQKNKYGFGGLLYTDSLCSNFSAESPLERSYDKKNDLSTTYLYKNEVCYVSSSGTGSWRMTYLNSASTPTAPLLSPALLGLQKYAYTSKDTCSISSSKSDIDSAYAHASVIVNGKCQGGLSQDMPDERLVCDALKVSRSAFGAGASCKGTASVTTTLAPSAYANCELDPSFNEYTTVSCYVGPTTAPTPAPSSSKPSTAMPTAAPFVIATNSATTTALSPGVVSGVAAVLILVACCVINFTCLRYVDTCNLEARREKAWRDAHAPPPEGEETDSAWKDVDADAAGSADSSSKTSDAESDDVRVSMAEMYNPMRSSSFVSVNLSSQQLPLETKAEECREKVKAAAAARAAKDQIPAQPVKRGSAFETFVNPFFGNKGLSAKKETPRGQGISTSAIRAQIASPSSAASQPPPPPPPPSSASSSSATSSTNPFA